MLRAENRTRAHTPRIALGVFCICFLPLSVFADRITLRSGQILTGAIVGQDRSSIRIQVGGQIQVVSKNQIVRVQYDTDEPGKVDPAKKENPKPVEKPVEERKPEIKKPVVEQEPKKEIQKPADTRGTLQAGSTSLVGAVWRSLLVPGWGQYANGRNIEAVIAAASTAAVVYKAKQDRSLARGKESEYQQTTFASFFLPASIGGSFHPEFANGGQLNVSAIGLVALAQRDSRKAAHESADLYGRTLGALAFVYLAQAAHSALSAKGSFFTAEAGRPRVIAAVFVAGSEPRKTGTAIVLGVTYGL